MNWERIKWFDRHFNFDFPTALYPEMIERLRGAIPRLEEHCRDLEPATLTKRLNERWSIQENAGHLLDLESLVDARIDDYLAHSTELKAADLSNRKTFDARYNEVAVDVILSSFRKARTEIVKRLEGFEANVFDRKAIHPRLKVSMRLVDLLFFTAEHDDYHLTRIRELTRS